MALEKQYQTLFNRWCQHEFHGNAVFELKKTDKSLPFDAVKEHQVNALWQAKHGKIVFKIPDLGSQNPFDSFQMEKVGAYVVIFYEKAYENNGPSDVKEFFLVDIDLFLNERENSGKKSLSMEKAKEIGLRRSLKKNHK